MKESQLVKRLLARFTMIPGCKVVKFHGNQFTRSGEPDLFGSYLGRIFVIEAKVGGNKLTRLQEQRLKEWAEAGAVAVTAREGFDVEEFIRFVKWKGANHV